MKQALSNANATRTNHTLELMKLVPPLGILSARGLIYYGCAANRWDFLELALSSATSTRAERTPDVMKQDLPLGRSRSLGRANWAITPALITHRGWSIARALCWLWVDPQGRARQAQRCSAWRARIDLHVWLNRVGAIRALSLTVQQPSSQDSAAALTFATSALPPPASLIACVWQGGWQRPHCYLGSVRDWLD